MDREFWRQWLPIGVSFLSLTLASVALGWNIYRDVVLKARVRVRFAVVSFMSQGDKTMEQLGKPQLRIAATNHGPGPVTITMIVGQIAPLWRRLIRRPQHFVILNDKTNPLNPQLPCRLEVGETLSLYLLYDESCFLKQKATRIGVDDSFGRLHFAPRRDVTTGRQQYQKDFMSGG